MTDRAKRERRLPVGVEVTGDGLDVRVWAPKRRRVAIVLEDVGPSARSSRTLEPEGDGYFSGLVAGRGAGIRYAFELDGEGPFADPASRFQPDGPHGFSEVVDPARFRWTDREWQGPDFRGAVFYELHVGTFTRGGTWASAMAELPRLAKLGITIVEVMPVADFAGRFGWGYDGVNLFAPTRLYGKPDDLRAFVDGAHALGLGVILDVVYNHIGPSGNYLPRFSATYFNDKVQTEWGPAINYDGEGSGPVRELVVANAGYWVDEMHFDGLRLDATQDIHDMSSNHLLRVIGERVRKAAKGRKTVVIAENEPQEARLVRSREEDGFALDGVWNDDYQHAARVAMTGRREAYYTDYTGSPQELVSAVKYGYLYQGQRYVWQRKRRGSPAFDVEPWRFVTYLENHDQVANFGVGARLVTLSSPARRRALVALTLLGPGAPLLFQGEELGLDAPFPFFADHEPELAELVAKGRRQFLSQFPSAATEEVQRRVPRPDDPRTFESAKLDRTRSDPLTHALYEDLLRLRREDTALGHHAQRVDGAVLSERSFAIRFFGVAGNDRLLLVNLGHDLSPSPCPEPLLAPPAGADWACLWSSEDPRYGGSGTRTPYSEGAFDLVAESAVVLHAVTEGAT